MNKKIKLDIMTMKAVPIMNHYIQKKENIIQKNDLSALDKSFFGFYIVKWLNSAKIRCKRSTYSNYLYITNARIIPIFSNVKLKNITSELIDDYTSTLLNEGLLPKTVKDILIILKQILNYANINIKISMPKLPKNEIKIFSKSEQFLLEKKLLDNMDRIKLGIYLSLYTGLRIGELCALKIQDIDIENKKIKVKKTITRIRNFGELLKNKTIVIIDEPKSTSSIREIPISEFIIPILKKFILFQEPTNFFITGNNDFLETRTYFNKYKKILKEINLQHYNFHALRHTFATRCIENGCDPKTLSEILGHSNVKITLERYVHPNYENKVKLINQLRPIYY